ncbi:relaxase/mobilization nuclease domain-containing protein [Microbacterium sp. MPKO10]|uniref:relaxase/mobilization nuclease domain-containing protein n=1 Tax=Microbacterium sp. MPKO10 TaxID=2989818 RepID=UPI00355606F6
MVAAPPPRSSRNASGGIRYLTTGTAHDGSDKPRSWYLDGIDCAPETAAAEWRSVRQRFGKDGTRSRLDESGREATEGAYVQAVHIVLSYDPNDPEAIRRAHEQSREVAELIRDGHQVVMATQNDGLGSDGVGKVHTHIYINAVHPETGRSANGRHTARRTSTRCAARSMRSRWSTAATTRRSWPSGTARSGARRRRSGRGPAASTSGRTTSPSVWTAL